MRSPTSRAAAQSCSASESHHVLRAERSTPPHLHPTQLPKTDLATLAHHHANYSKKKVRDHASYIFANNDRIMLKVPSVPLVRTVPLVVRLRHASCELNDIGSSSRVAVQVLLSIVD